MRTPRWLAALVVVFFAGSVAPAQAAPELERRHGNIDLVNPLIGTDGESATEYGGMIPSTAPPFAMTRWSPMTRQNWVSRLPYHHDDTKITGFIGTHQPAIWMGDYGYVVGMPGIGDVKPTMEARGLPFRHEDERAKPDRYSVDLDAGGGKKLRAELTGTSRVGVMRFSYPQGAPANFVLEATRAGITGNVRIDPARREISGYNPDRQDSKLGPFKAPNFKGYFVASFDTGFDSFGTSSGGALHEGETGRTDPAVGAFARFPAGTRQVQVRIATSFISVEQARENLRREAPDPRSFDRVAAQTRAAWSEKLDRVAIEGATPDQLANFYTGMFHALQYPSEMSEYGRYYSAYDDRVHRGVSYTSYSLWDTFRAENAFLTLFAPERVDDMVTSMLHDFTEGGWLPMWKNPAETNIMVGTNADSIIAEAINKGFTGFDRELAYRAVYKDAMTPPDRDTELRYADREEGTPVEARAGLTWYQDKGWVAADRTAEAGSRTLDYAYEDWAVAQVAKAVGRTADAEFFLRRSQNYRTLYNASTGFMQSRNLDGSWAKGGWTEGDEWVYTFDVMHDVPGLIDLMGRDRFLSTLDRHLAEGHNNHTNEPSHHIAYLYDYAGQAWKTQERVRQIAKSDYANRPDGLSGNDDCGQMSSWYLLSAMGIYPVNPASDQYAIGSPFFTKVTVRLPGRHRPLVISAPGNSDTNQYVQGVRLNGKPVTKPFLSHRDLTGGGELRFTMGPSPRT
ncbi:GH92 family glycosyl hydrolase [Amycolatopsis anabasis]|uniref:GH92 family glycosyl hydrolase n=1 Tax=Amycolatopsis anabasis TaxID=1840409 RepID=UPI00131B6BB0|nr:GH92 family glycosyl hydrolase [Amycolatopsis anabasis]